VSTPSIAFLPRVSCRSTFCRRVRLIMVEKGFIGNAAEGSFASTTQISKITRLWHPAAMSKPAYLEMQTLTTQQLQPEDVGEPRRLWGEVLKSYKATSLSHEQDRLVAISGIASILQTQLRMEASLDCGFRSS
jgi:hypothetical protein